MSITRMTDDEGRVIYTDVPQAGQRARPDSRDAQRDDLETSRRLMAEARSRIPKIPDYLRYLDYLRHHSPVRFDRVMNELRRDDPETWLKLQKYAQFRPLKDSLVGHKAASRWVTAGAGMLAGKFGSSFEKWLETSLAAQMERDRFGPYARLQGPETSSPARPATYSRSRLGQYLQVEDARLAAEGAKSAKAVQAGQAALRAARATAVVRVGTFGVDAGLAALTPEQGHAHTARLMRNRLDRIAQVNPAIDIDTAAYETARGLLSSGQYGELDRLLKTHE